MNENEIKDSQGFAALMRLIRPKQWIKNMFIFVPLFLVVPCFIQMPCRRV